MMLYWQAIPTGIRHRCNTCGVLWSDTMMSSPCWYCGQVCSRDVHGNTLVNPSTWSPGDTTGGPLYLPRDVPG